MSTKSDVFRFGVAYVTVMVTSSFSLMFCATSEQQKKLTLEQAIKGTVIAADITYGMVVELCDKREKEIIARPISTLEADREDLSHVRGACDRLFKIFEEARHLQLMVSEVEAL